MATQRILVSVGATLLVGMLGACRGGTSKSPPIHAVLDMDFQQKLKAQSASGFSGWADGRGMRTPVEGTVSRSAYLGDPGELLAAYDIDSNGRLDRHEASRLRVGKMFATVDRNKDASLDLEELTWAGSLFVYKNADGTFVAENPLPRTDEVLQRGRQRFNINCAVCHGKSGTGGVVAPRWSVPLPDLIAHEDETTRARLIGLPYGEIVGAMTDGKGTMPSYAHQVTWPDRWAIAHYLKALQEHYN
ncbi:MAG: c-type cytochrome [Planctomycetota bacterium]